MISSNAFLGIAASVIGIIAYVPYFRGIFSGKTKPHAFSWLVWSVLTGISFAIQLVEGGGPGAWPIGITSVACSAVFILALIKGDRSFPFFDWASLTVAFVALALWLVTSEPIPSVILICMTDAVGYFPSFRKGFLKPFEETATTFALDEVKLILSLFALDTFSIATTLYPLVILILNGLYVLMLLIRRVQLKKS